MPLYLYQLFVLVFNHNIGHDFQQNGCKYTQGKIE